jgi:hypothetical protein
LPFGDNDEWALYPDCDFDHAQSFVEAGPNA